MLKRRDVSSTPQRLLFELIQGYSRTQVVYVIARLGIVDLLKEASGTVAELSVQLDLDAGRLYRLMLAAEDLGLCVSERSEHERYSLTDSGRCLISDSPGSLRELAILSGEENYRAWGELLYSVQTGNKAFDRVFGMDLFTYAGQDPQVAERFHGLLSGQARLSARAVLTSYSFASVSKVVDIGGGHGALISAILNAYPHLNGVLFDQASTIAEATKQLTISGVISRCQLIAGNFFENVPQDGDIYIVSQVIHDWDDESAINILRNCCRAMRQGGKLLIIERVMPENMQNASSVIWSDLSMLILTGGQERMAAQYQTLLEAAGFQLLRLVPTGFAITIIEATPQSV